MIFELVFSGRNLWSYLEREDAPFQKDTVCRLLNNTGYNWRMLLLLTARNVLRFLIPLTSGERKNVFIIDPSLFGRTRSKALELPAEVYGHAARRFVKDFRIPALGWSDGNTFIPVNFAPLSSENHDNRLVEANPAIDKRSAGYRRRRESVRKSTSVLLDLVGQAQKAGLAANHPLFDSWFAFPSLIRSIVSESLHMPARESRKSTDSRTVGGMFYQCRNELEDRKFVTALVRILAALREVLRTATVSQ